MRLAFTLLVFFVSYAPTIATVEQASPYDPFAYYFSPYHNFMPQVFRTDGTNLGGLTKSFWTPPRTAIRILTSTITCTLSVSNPCSVRDTVSRPERLRPARPGRPAVSTEQLLDNVGENVEAQFLIAPSAVQGVEATPFPTRDDRSADPQRFMISPTFRYPSQDIQSAFEGGPYEMPIGLPFNRQFALAGQQQRQMPAFIQGLFASRTMTTTFKLATFTFTPFCSVPGTLPQCPNGE